MIFVTFCLEQRENFLNFCNALTEGQAPFYVLSAASGKHENRLFSTFSSGILFRTGAEVRG